MSFQFIEYTALELEACGRAFQQHFASCTLAGNRPWSGAIFDWFRMAAAPGMRVYPPGAGTKDEFIVDQCHMTYPVCQSNEAWPSLGWYERAVRGRCEMKL